MLLCLSVVLLLLPCLSASLERLFMQAVLLSPEIYIGNSLRDILHISWEVVVIICILKECVATVVTTPVGQTDFLLWL